MTQKSTDRRGLEAWVNHELHRIRRENRIRRAVVLTGLAAFAFGLSIATWLAYTDVSDGAAGESAPLTGTELEAVSE